MKIVEIPAAVRDRFQRGAVIPALPLALDSERRFSERHERALIRYYAAAGCGGLAVGVHSTQFAIREPQHGLFEPVLTLAAETLAEAEGTAPMIRIAGVCGRRAQAVREATLARNLGYHATLLSLTAVKESSIAELLDIHEVLRRQQLLPGTWCLDPQETLSPGQSAEIDRVQAAYPHLNDDEFVAAHRDVWLA